MRTFLPPVWAGLHFRDGLELNLSEFGRCGVISSDTGRWQSWPARSIVAINDSIQYSSKHPLPIPFLRFTRTSLLLHTWWSMQSIHRYLLMFVQRLLHDSGGGGGCNEYSNVCDACSLWGPGHGVCVSPLSVSACGTESWRISTYQKYQNLDKKIGG